MGVLPVRLSLFKLLFSSCFCSRCCVVDRKPEDGGHNNQGGMTDRGGPMSPGSGPSSPFGKDSPTGSNQNTTLALQLQLLQTKTQSSLNNLYTTISPEKASRSSNRLVEISRTSIRLRRSLILKHSNAPWRSNTALRPCKILSTCCPRKSGYVFDDQLVY